MHRVFCRRCVWRILGLKDNLILIGGMDPGFEENIFDKQTSKMPVDSPNGIVNLTGIFKLSEFDQKLGNTRMHNSLIVQHSDCWPEVENQPKLT